MSCFDRELQKLECLVNYNQSSRKQKKKKKKKKKGDGIAYGNWFLSIQARDEANGREDG